MFYLSPLDFLCIWYLSVFFVRSPHLSFGPRPPPFCVFQFAFSIIHGMDLRKKMGRPGLIHHVSDIRWTRGGRENDVRGKGPTAWALQQWLGPFRRSRVRMLYHRPIGKFSLYKLWAYTYSKLRTTLCSNTPECVSATHIIFEVGLFPLTSFLYPPRVHLTSLTWWMRPGLPRFSHSSVAVYYTECKPKNTKRGRPGNEANPTCHHVQAIGFL